MAFRSKKEQVDYYLGNKKAFYHFMLRKKFFMPDLKCSAVTVAWMDEVWRGEVWCPKQFSVHPI